ncbi:unnamed protein product [Lota lota]
MWSPQPNWWSAEGHWDTQTEGDQTSSAPPHICKEPSGATYFGGDWRVCCHSLHFPTGFGAFSSHRQRAQG